MSVLSRVFQVLRAPLPLAVTRVSSRLRRNPGEARSLRCFTVGDFVAEQRALGYSNPRLLHATPTKNLPDIQRRGLVPSLGVWGARYETPRIYLSDDTNTLYAVAGQMIVDESVSSVSAIEIDPSGLLQAVLHEDPDWEGEPTDRAWYIEQPIPPTAIGRVIDSWDRSDFD